MKKQLVICFLVVLMNIILCSCSSNISDNMNLDDISNSFSQDEEKDDNDISDVGESIDVEKSTDVNTVIDFDPQVVKEVLDIDISGEYVHVPQVCDFEVPVEIADLGGEHIGELYEDPIKIQQALTKLYLFYNTQYKKNAEESGEQLINILVEATGVNFIIVDFRIDFYYEDQEKAVFYVKQESEDNICSFEYYASIRIFTPHLIVEEYEFQKNDYWEKSKSIEEIANRYYENAFVDYFALDSGMNVIDIYVFSDEEIRYEDQQKLINGMLEEYCRDKDQRIVLSIVYISPEYKDILLKFGNLTVKHNSIGCYQEYLNRNQIYNCFIYKDYDDRDGCLPFDEWEDDDIETKMSNWLY